MTMNRTARMMSVASDSFAIIDLIFFYSAIILTLSPISISLFSVTIVFSVSVTAFFTSNFTDSLNDAHCFDSSPNELYTGPFSCLNDK